MPNWPSPMRPPKHPRTPSASAHGCGPTTVAQRSSATSTAGPDDDTDGWTWLWIERPPRLNPLDSQNPTSPAVKQGSDVNHLVETKGLEPSTPALQKSRSAPCEPCSAPASLSTSVDNLPVVHLARQSLGDSLGDRPSTMDAQRD